MPHRIRRFLPVLLGALLLPTGAAHAGAVSDANLFGDFGFTDSGNEANALTVTPTAGDYRFQDTNVAVTASGNCSAAMGVGFCPAADATGVGISLGNNTDTLFAGSVSLPLRVFAGASVDSITTGSGDDAIVGGTGNDFANAGDGADFLRDGGVIFAGSGDGVDTYNGEGGDDTIDAGQLPGDGVGGDTLNGGNGSAAPAQGDLLDYSLRTGRVVVSQDGIANDGDPTVPGGGEKDNVSNFETILVTAQNDAVTGGAAGENLFGAGGDDDLKGGGGADFLYGGTATNPDGSGDDTLDGGAGGDRFFGGDGNDVVTYGTRVAAVTVVLDNLPNDGEAGEGDRIYPDVERIVGGTAGDTLTGSGDVNALAGGPGGDTITGGSGDDVLEGNADGDTVNGGSGDDNVSGGEGPDSIDGGTGSDTVSGGDGDDTIAARDNSPDAITCDSGTDTVVADAVDNVAGDCEIVDRPPLEKSPENPPPPPPPPPPVDTVAPVVTLSPTKLKLTRKGEAVVTITCPAIETGGCSGTATLEALASKKPKITKQTLGRTSWKATAGQKLKLTIKLSAKARALVKKHKKVKSRLVVTARDTAGNTAQATRPVLIQRR